MRLNQPMGPRPLPSKSTTPGHSKTSPQSIRLVPEASDRATTSSQGKAHDSPQLPPIVVPELGGQSMEQFFSRTSNHANLNQPSNAELPNVPALGNRQEEDDGRFADADDDISNNIDSLSFRSSVITTRTTTTATTPSSGESSPGIRGFGHGISGQGHHHRRYTIQAPIPAIALPAVIPGRFQFGPVPQLQAPPARGSIRRDDMPTNSMMPPLVPLRPKSMAMDRTAGTSSEKENASSPGATRRQRAGTISTQSPKEAMAGSFLERRRTLGDRRVQIVLPGEEAKFGKQSHPSKAMQGIYQDSD